MRAVYPESKRGIGQTRFAGEEPDVTGTPWWIEAKHRKVVNLWEALEQAEAARATCKSTYAKAPLLVIAKRDKEKPVVVLHHDVFMRMLAELEALRRAADLYIDSGEDK